MIFGVISEHPAALSGKNNKKRKNRLVLPFLRISVLSATCLLKRRGNGSAIRLAETFGNVSAACLVKSRGNRLTI